VFDQQFSPDQPFDGLQQLALVVLAERHGDARRAGAAGPADPMHVHLGLVWQVVIEHMRYAVHVDAARRDVGSNEDRRPIRFEAGQRALPSRLALVAMHRFGADPDFVQLLGDAVRAVFGSGKDQGPGHALCLQQIGQQLGLALAGHKTH